MMCDWLRSIHSICLILLLKLKFYDWLFFLRRIALNRVSRKSFQNFEISLKRASCRGNWLTLQGCSSFGCGGSCGRLALGSSRCSRTSDRGICWLPVGSLIAGWQVVGLCVHWVVQVVASLMTTTNWMELLFRLVLSTRVHWVVLFLVGIHGLVLSTLIGTIFLHKFLIVWLSFLMHWRIHRVIHLIVITAGGSEADALI